MISLNGKRKQKQSGIRLSTPLESNFKWSLKHKIAIAIQG